MKNLRIEEGMDVVVRGGTSGVGVAFAKLVHAGFDGVGVIGTTRDAAKEGRLIAAGFDACMLDCKGELKTRDCYDRALELVGPATMKDTCSHVRAGGIVCSTGQLGGQWYLDGFDPIMDLPANGYLTSAYSANVDGGVLQELFDYIEAHDIEVTPERVFPIERTADAHAYLESSRSFGKVVVLP